MTAQPAMQKVVKSHDGVTLPVMGSQVRFLCRGEDTGGAWSVLEAVIPRDVGPPPHHHAWDEAYYIVDGDVRFVIAGEVQLASAGDFVLVPGGVAHGFQGASDRPARVVIFDAPAHTEGFFVDAAREIVDMPADFAKVPAIGARHQITFLPR